MADKFSNLSSQRKAGLIVLYILAALFVVAMIVNLLGSQPSLAIGDVIILLIIVWGINKVQHPKAKDFPSKE